MISLYLMGLIWVSVWTWGITYMVMSNKELKRIGKACKYILDNMWSIENHLHIKKVNLILYGRE